MPQVTNLNIAPYYDDFNEGKGFHKVLFRPGYSIQARELTTLQSIFQNQVERFGAHVFKEGSVVIPGQVSYSDHYLSVKLASTFAEEQIKLNQYLNLDNPVIITGETSGVQAKVYGYRPGKSDRQPYLFVDIIKAGNDNRKLGFDNGENISANIVTQHASNYSANSASLKTFTEADPSRACTQVGSAVKVEAGVYFIRGQFVRCKEQIMVMSPNYNKLSARIGFVILEKLETPENDTTLTDNSTGATNYAAKGAHRLKLKLRLRKIPINAPIPSNFVELMQIRQGAITKKARVSDYSVLGDELARRTHDESGDYTTKPFTFKVQEQIDNEYKGQNFKGTYGSVTGANVVTDDNILADKALLNLQVSTGKAYVKGYEVEKIGLTNMTLGKARNFNNVNAGVSSFTVGNFAFVKNVYGMPEISEISGESTPYREIGLYTDQGTRGYAGHQLGNANFIGLDGDHFYTNRGFKIGTARARTIEYSSGTQGSRDAIYKLYLFDIRMFTRLGLKDIAATNAYGGLLSSLQDVFANHSNGGVQVKGVTSGATGYLYKTSHPADYLDNRIALTNVVGTFSYGEKLTISDSSESDKILQTSDGDVTVQWVHTYKFEEMRSFHMETRTTATGSIDANFSADAVFALVDDQGKILLDGTDENAVDEFSQMISDGEGVIYETQRVAKLIEPEKNISIFKLPKNTIKTLLTTKNDGVSDTQFTVRRQFIGTTNSSGAVSFSATGTNETFVSFTNTDYVCAIITPGGSGSGSAGDIIALSGNITGDGTSTITITDNSVLGSSTKVKLIATILKTEVATKKKTTNLCKQLKVIATDVDGAYGTRATDQEISLGRADVYKVISVYDSLSTSTDASIPSMTLTSLTGTFERGEKITGASTGAIARILTTTSPMSYALIGGDGAINFSAGEIITGAASKATATVGILTAGSSDITSNFILDTGQRDNYYDISRIVRRKGAPTPLGRLLVVYDYLAHGSGDAFTVDSYSSSAGQMNYQNIPVYTATKVDPDQPEPSGTFPLRDCFDFRPTVEDIAGTSTTVTTVDQITANSFNMHARQFDGTGAVVVDSPKPSSNVQADFEHFVGYRAALYLARNGQFILKYGVAGEIPSAPPDVPDALKLCSISVPAFTFSPQDVSVLRYKTQRFTMRDIGKLKNRIERLEDVTSLTLLEQAAESFEIQDQNGLNRFKSGFVVDNFKGHRVGDALNEDYKCAVDIIEGELRPKCVMRHVQLVEKNTTDAARLANGYQRTGDLITLPYVQQIFIDQQFGTKIENPQPYQTPSFIGNINLIPSGDDWFEHETAPVLSVNVMGTYDTVLANKHNSIGTFWNAWNIVSTGVSTEQVDQQWVASGHSAAGHTESLITTNIDTYTYHKARTGVTNTVVEDIVNTSNTSISTAMIPFCRSRKIKFIGECFMPNKRVYVFFDGVDVNAFCEPLSPEYSDQLFDTSSPSEGSAVSTANHGKNLVTNSVGKIEGFFTIPDHKHPGQENVPKFETQKDIEFRITSSPTNDKVGQGGVLVSAATAGQTSYEAVGTLETTQETITSTKNGKFVQTSVDETTVITETGGQYTTTSQTTFVAAPVVNEPIDTDGAEDWPPSGNTGSGTSVINTKGGVDIYLNNNNDPSGGTGLTWFEDDPSTGIPITIFAEEDEDDYIHYVDTSSIAGVYAASGWDDEDDFSYEFDEQTFINQQNNDFSNSSSNSNDHTYVDTSSIAGITAASGYSSDPLDAFGGSGDSYYSSSTSTSSSTSGSSSSSSSSSSWVDKVTSTVSSGWESFTSSSWWSDESLKEDIKLIGKSPSGINIYSFKYKHSDGIYEGVLAQEVPQARIMTDLGFYMVDYSKLDVDFKRLN